MSRAERMLHEFIIDLIHQRAVLDDSITYLEWAVPILDRCYEDVCNLTEATPMTRPGPRLITRRSPKPCGRCGEFDPACGFGVDMDRNDGLSLYCAQCSHRANRERYLRDRRDLQRRTRYEGEPYREPKVEGFECCDYNFRSEEARAGHRKMRGCGK